MGASDAIKFYEVFSLCIWQQMFGSFFASTVTGAVVSYVRLNKHGVLRLASEVQFRCELQLETEKSQHQPGQSSAQCAGLILSPMKDIYVEDLYELGFFKSIKVQWKSRMCQFELVCNYVPIVVISGSNCVAAGVERIKVEYTPIRCILILIKTKH